MPDLYEILKSHIDSHPPDFGDGDSVLTMLYKAYAEANPMDDGQLKQDFNDLYQGIPIGGYTAIIEKMLDGVEVKLNTDFFDDREKWVNAADKIIFTGMIDQYFDYCYGELEYRGLDFEFETLDMENYQGNAVINYTDAETPYTRIIEHKHFEGSESEKTIITREYPKTWKKGEEAYYPMNDDKNSELFERYEKLAEKEGNVIFGGRLGMYKYYDMWQVIDEALKLVQKLE